MGTKQVYVKPILRDYGDLRTITGITILPGKDLGSADGLILTQSGQQVPVASVS
jgi:hypothetical protein